MNLLLHTPFGISHSFKLFVQGTTPSDSFITVMCFLCVSVFNNQTIEPPCIIK